MTDDTKPDTFTLEAMEIPFWKAVILAAVDESYNPEHIRGAVAVADEAVFALRERTVARGK